MSNVSVSRMFILTCNLSFCDRCFSPAYVHVCLKSRHDITNRFHFRMCITAVNGACGHIFCGKCIVQAWVHSARQSVEVPMRCPVCRGALPGMEDLWRRNLKNMPFRRDQHSQRVAKPMMNNVQRAAAEFPGDLLRYGGDDGRQLVDEWGLQGVHAVHRHMTET